MYYVQYICMPIQNITYIMLQDVDMKYLQKEQQASGEVQQAEREKDKPLLFPFRFTFLQNKTFSLV